jgi:molybdopterin-guanine dinucleotide biosynthesis protein A
MNDLTTNNVTAILLAGGRGSRMNHQDKAWVTHRGRPLIQHVLESLKDQTGHIIISRNRDDSRYEALGYPCVKDKFIDQHGPLAGIVSCLKQVSTPLTLIVPCDTPSLPANLVEILSSDLNDADIVIASDGKRVQQLIMLARTSVLWEIEHYLAAGRRSVMGWLKTMNYEVAVFDGGSDQFENINETTQLEQ